MIGRLSPVSGLSPTLVEIRLPSGLHERNAGRQQERWQITCEIAEWEHFRLEPNAQYIRHKRSPGLDPRPSLRKAVSKLRPASLIKQGYPILDVDRRVIRPCGWNNVDLQCLAGTETLSTVRIDRRVHPLVKMDKMTGVQNKSKERIAKVPTHHGVNLATAYSKADGFIPIRGARKIRSCEALTVILNGRWQFCGIVNQKT